MSAAHLETFDRSLAALRLKRPDRITAIARSMQRDGQLRPVVATAAGSMLVDGFKRWYAAEQLGWDRLEVRTLELEPAHAAAAILTLNAREPAMTCLEEALVVTHLVRERGLAQKQVATILGRHKSWVCRRLQLLERVGPQVIRDVRLGLVSVSIARELARLPRGNQEQVCGCILRHGLSARHTRALVTAWLERDLAGRSELLSDPGRVLRVDQAGPARTETTLRRALARLDHSARDALVTLRASQAQLTATDQARIEPLCERLHQCIAVLVCARESPCDA